MQNVNTALAAARSLLRSLALASGLWIGMFGRQAETAEFLSNLA